MSLVSVKDFGIALNISGGTIRSKISRGQLLRNKNKLIDTEHPVNFAYLLEVNGGDQSVFDDYSVGNSAKTNLRKKVNEQAKEVKKITINQNVVKNEVKTVENHQKVKNEKPNEINGSVNIAPTVETEILEQKKHTKNEVYKPSAEEIREKKFQEKINKSFLELEKRKKEAEVSLVERNAELKQWELEKKAGNTLPLNMIENVIDINFKAIYKTNFSLANNVAYVVVNQLGGTKEDLHRIRQELENVFDKTVKDTENKAALDIQKLIDEYSEIRSRGERKV